MAPGEAVAEDQPGAGCKSRYTPDSAQPPGPAHPRNTVSLARGDRDDGAHRFDLRWPKGWPASTLATFSTESPLSMAIPPTLARRRSITSSRMSRGRCFKFDTPPSGKAPRQPPTSTAVSLRRRAGAGFAVICEVSAAPAPSRSTFFCSGIQHLNHPLFSGLEWRLKKSEAGDIATQYEKAPQNFMAMVKLAAVRIWIKYYELAACQCCGQNSETGGLSGESW